VTRIVDIVGLWGHPTGLEANRQGKQGKQANHGFTVPGKQAGRAGVQGGSPGAHPSATVCAGCTFRVLGAGAQPPTIADAARFAFDLRLGCGAAGCLESCVMGSSGLPTLSVRLSSGRRRRALLVAAVVVPARRAAAGGDKGEKGENSWLATAAELGAEWGLPPAKCDSSQPCAAAILPQAATHESASEEAGPPRLTLRCSLQAVPELMCEWVLFCSSRVALLGTECVATAARCWPQGDSARKAAGGGVSSSRVRPRCWWCLTDQRSAQVEARSASLRVLRAAPMRVDEKGKNPQRAGPCRGPDHGACPPQHEPGLACESSGGAPRPSANRSVDSHLLRSPTASWWCVLKRVRIPPK
jgi:hypothetical protein